MSLKVGDKVSFLNEKLDGVVSKVLNSKTVEVKTADGFSIPSLVAELVKVGGSNESDSKNSQPVDTGVSFSKKISLEKKAYLCFAKNKDSFELFLLNNLPFKGVFLVRVKKGADWVAVFSSEVSKSSYKFVNSYSLNEIDSFSDISVEILNADFSVTNIEGPRVANMKIKSVKFFKDSSFVEIPIIEKNGLVLPIESVFVEEDQIKKEIVQHVESPRGQVEARKKLKGLKVLGKIDLGGPKDKKARYSEEIDIHIENLDGNWSNKSNAEIIQAQLKAAKEFLDTSMLKGKKEIVIIHGVGNGKLKTEVRNLLKGYYGIRFEDADFRKYGEGATLVYLK